MKELQVPFDSAWILKNRRKIKKALLADGTPRMEKKIAVLGDSFLDFCFISLCSLICSANVGCSPTPRQHF